MIKTARELAAAAKDVALNYKTLYVLGCFGAPMTQANKERWMREQSYNRKSDRAAKINAASADTFGFDCVCLIKALLWGWTGDASQQYGGAKYCSNGVPDIDDSQMIAVCSGVSTNFSNIQVGEVVWMQGHIGIYIGDGLAVECTPKWKDGVQITAVHNIGTKAGYNGRSWTKHGKLPYVTYEQNKPEESKGEITVNIEMTQISKGSKGKQVKTLQQLLIANGYSLPIFGADSDFGGETYNAVVQFQVKNNLEADGIVGKNTWNKLLKG